MAVPAGVVDVTEAHVTISRADPSWATVGTTAADSSGHPITSGVVVLHRVGGAWRVSTLGPRRWAAVFPPAHSGI
jgi:hypothetical protein